MQSSAKIIFDLAVCSCISAEWCDQSQTSPVEHCPSVAMSLAIQHQNAFPTSNDVACQIAHEFMLNDAQRCAFKIITDHASCCHMMPLCMFVGGAGGTGKSCVINSMKGFFIQSAQVNHFCVVSYMGVAACNIGGNMLHSTFVKFAEE